MADKYPQSDGWGVVDVTIDSGEVSADLADFPFLIDLSQLPEAAWALIAANSAEGSFRLLKSDNTTEVAREILFCDSSAKTGKIYGTSDGTLSSTSDTVFKLCFGKVGEVDYARDGTYGLENVWDSYYAAVYHGNDLTTSTISDSTSNDNDAAKSSANNPLEVSGKIYKAQNFSTDVITGTNPGIGINEACTLEAWIHPETSGGVGFGRIIDLGNLDLAMGDGAGDALLFKVATLSKRFGATPLTKNVDHHITAVHAGASTSIDCYLNGVSYGAQLRASTATTNFKIGDSIAGSRGFDGPLEGIRISKGIARTTDWIGTQFSNQDDPVAFAPITGYLPPITATGTGVVSDLISDLISPVLSGSVN